MKRDKLRSIPVKNYVYLCLVILVTFLILYYVYLCYDSYSKERLNKGILNDYLTVINYNELDDYIIENKNAVIYVSKLGNEDINRFEKSFKNVVVDNNLKNLVLYLDITGEDSGVYDRLKIDSNLPYIVVYTDGEITNTYSIVKNNYSTKKLDKYLNRIGIIEDD